MYECTVPKAVVENVGYNPDAVNSSHAELTWDAVDLSIRDVRGFLRGYQVTEQSVNVVTAVLRVVHHDVMLRVVMCNVGDTGEEKYHTPSHLG